MTTKPEFATFTGFAELMIQTYERYLPTAFDDSLTQLQKMNKIIVYLNEVGKVTSDAFTRWNEVMEWVMNDGLETTVSNELDSMVADGTFNSIINQELLGSRARVEVSYTEPTTPDDRTYWLEKRSDEDVQIKYRNGTAWTDIFPITQESNVVAEDGVTLNNKLVTINDDINKVKNEVIYYKNFREFGAVGDGVTDCTKAFEDFQAFHLTNVVWETGKRTKLFIPSGKYIINKPMSIISNTDLLLDDGAELIFNVTGRYAVMFDGTKNARWQGGKITRRGNTAETYANCVEVKWDCDETLEFVDIEFNNEAVAQASNVQCSGIMIHGVASPILKGVVGRGGKGSTTNGQFCFGIRIGGTGYSATSPKLYDCIGYGGQARNSSGIEIDNTMEGGKVHLFNCIGYGGTGNECNGIVIDDISVGVLEGCIGYGGNGGQANRGLVVWACQAMEVKNSSFYGGNKTNIAGNNCDGVYVHNGFAVFENCNAYAGVNAYYSAGWNVDGEVILRHCNAGTQRTASRLEYSSQLNYLKFSDFPVGFSVNSIGLQCLGNLSGVTVNIGTTSGGNEIAENVPLVNSAWVRLFFGKGIKKPLTDGDKIYITPNTPVADGLLIVVASISTAREHYGLLVSNGAYVQAYNCVFRVEPTVATNTCVGIVPNSANDNGRFYNCVIESHVGNAVHGGSNYPESTNFLNTTIIGTKFGLI